MLKTLNLLSSIITDKTTTMTIEEIAEQYRESLNPSLLAAAFKKTFKLIITISNKYYGLNPDDIASFALEILDKCLQQYNPSRSGFTNYFIINLKFKFREETIALNADKRKSIFYSYSYETMVEDGFDLPTEMELDDIELLLKNYDLTPREMEYCKLVANDWTNKDIAAKFEVTPMRLSYIRKDLRKKLAPMSL